MWVARDKDGILNLFTIKPHREEVNWVGDFIGQLTVDRYWDEDPIIDRINGFETLKWEDEPIEVNLVTKEIDEEKLDKLAWESVNGYEENTEEFIKAFKLGYCKAMEK